MQEIFSEIWLAIFFISNNPICLLYKFALLLQSLAVISYYSSIYSPIMHYFGFLTMGIDTSTLV